MAEALDDCRFELKDSQDELRQALVLLHHANSFVDQARKREQRAIARLTLAQQRLGYTGFRPEEVMRVDEMTVRVSPAAVAAAPPPASSIGDPAALSRFAREISTSARAKATGRKA